MIDSSKTIHRKIFSLGLQIEDYIIQIMDRSFCFQRPHSLGNKGGKGQEYGFLGGNQQLWYCSWLISNLQQQYQRAHSSASPQTAMAMRGGQLVPAWLHLCCALLFIVWGKGREAAAVLKERISAALFQCTPAAGWARKVFCCFSSCETGSHSWFLVPQQTAENFSCPASCRSVWKKCSWNSSNLLLLPFPCLTQWTAGHSTDATMLHCIGSTAVCTAAAG